jgi:ABC-2 type transport system ATP-binding protein
MNDDIAIKVDDVSKLFEIPHQRVNTLKEYFINPFRKVNKDVFKALNDVNFEINKGEFVGIIGRNGSGKSTLLKMLAGIYSPTDGSIEVQGHLIPFLELGVGFNPELTGRENIFLNGTILGMSRKFLKEKFDEILDFAEIREFIDLQVKNYSSGMLMRLAFSVAIQARADIYLLDEILSVGDTAFQKKSLNKMLELLKSGATVILVSHSHEDVKKYCKRVIWIDKGKVMYDGKVKKGVDMYLASLDNPDREYETNNQINESKYSIVEFNNSKRKIKDSVGSGKADILSITWLNSKGKMSDTFLPSEGVNVNVKIKVNEYIQNPVIILILKHEDKHILGVNTKRNKKEILKSLDKGQNIEVNFTFNIHLNPGTYSLRAMIGNPGIHGKKNHELIRLLEDIANISVFDPKEADIPDSSGLVRHNLEYKVNFLKNLDE